MVEEKVKEGYKKTEVGIIPHDWNCIQLSSEYVNIFNGGTPSTSINKYWNGNIKWCTPTDITSCKGNYIYTTERSITEEGLKNSSAVLLPIGTLLLCSRATIGDIRISKVEISTNQGFKNIVTKEKLYNEFLYYYLLTQKNKMKEKSIGSTFLEISKKEVSNLYAPLPPLHEQKDISDALNDVDNLLQSLEKLIDKKKKNKQGTMQQLLIGKKRLPGFSGEWAVKKFKDVTDLITCGIAATPNYVDSTVGVPFLSSTNVKNGKIIWRDYKYISQESHKKLYKNNPPTKDDILYSRVGTIGEAAIIESDSEFSIYVSLTLIKLKNFLFNGYIVQLLNSNKYKSLANRTVLLGGGVGNLNVNVVREFEIPVPSLEEQKEISKVLSDMDSEIESLKQKLEKYKKIKQGMMQELLTGRIRLI